jgi:transposase-like protein
MDRDKIVELYTHGISGPAIARILTVSESYVYQTLDDAGVQRRSRSDANKKKCSDYVIIALYNLGLSAPQIGRLLKLDASTITKRLHARRFPLRSRKMAAAIKYDADEFEQLAALLGEC